ncbi:hypothetical protein INR49_032079 [Caranx melampygus]|nr:hypothetical protein INR49_032079 [Caranx melampygus]
MMQRRTGSSLPARFIASIRGNGKISRAFDKSVVGSLLPLLALEVWPLHPHVPSSRSKSSKMSSSSSSHSSGYPQFLRSFHPSEAALAQEQLHPGVGRFEHFAGGSSSSGSAGGLGGLVTSAPPPPPPLHPGLSVPQASPGPSSSSPSPSTSVATSNNPSSSSAVSSLGHQLVGAHRSRTPSRLPSSNSSRLTPFPILILILILTTRSTQAPNPHP